MLKIILAFLFITFSGFAFSQEKANPFITQIGKPYSEYHAAYNHFVDSLFYGDSSSRAELLRLFSETAAAGQSDEWHFNRQLIEYDVRFFESRDGGFVVSGDYTAENHANNMIALAAFAKEKGLPFCRIKALFNAAEAYRIFLQNYERAFAYYLEMASELDKVSTKDFPPRLYYYRRLGDLYYMFREYPDATTYYNKVIDDPDVLENMYRDHYSAMNGLGLCYRNGNKDYGRSEDCFRRILEWTNEEGGSRKWVWEGVAEGNIGYNYYLQGDWNTALAWLVPAIDKITNPGDFPFASSRAVNVADIYIKKQELELAKKYIDIALDRHYRSGIPEKGSGLYDVLSKYYACSGNRRKAVLYHDSTLITKSRENEAFSGLVLRRVEQQLRVADNKIHEQELDAEQAKSQTYLHTTFIVSVALALILVLLVFTLVFYFRNRNAYRELVRKNRQWAGVESPVINEMPDDNPTKSGQEECAPATNGKLNAEAAGLHAESDKRTMESIEKALSESKLYKQPDFTLDGLAQHIHINRYYISTVLNRCTGKNFNVYINEYRIKEAIRLISDSAFTNPTFEAIAFEAGFNDRTSFYRAFKKVTGLSPGDFRKNMNRQ